MHIHVRVKRQNLAEQVNIVNYVPVSTLPNESAPVPYEVMAPGNLATSDPEYPDSLTTNEENLPRLQAG